MAECSVCKGERWIKVKAGKPEVPCFKCNPSGNVPKLPRVHGGGR